MTDQAAAAAAGGAACGRGPHASAPAPPLPVKGAFKGQERDPYRRYQARRREDALQRQKAARLQAANTARQLAQGDDGDDGTQVCG